MPWVSTSTPLECQSYTQGNEDRTRQTPRRASVRRRATATVGSAAADAHKTAATIATDARIRITVRMTWYWSHLLRSLLQSPGSAFKYQAATRLLIGTRQISENGTVTASKAADDQEQCRRVPKRHDPSHQSGQRLGRLSVRGILEF